MNDFSAMKFGGRKLVTTKSIFLISVIVGILTVLSIWLFGLGQHRTIFQNSILSTTMLSLFFLFFITTGLYNGFKLKDNLGNITYKINFKKKIQNLEENADVVAGGPQRSILDYSDSDDIFINVVFWIFISTLIISFIIFLGALFWGMILAFVAMLYWIFFRALRLIFKKSNKCKGHFIKSLAYALTYTILYNFWIYGIILISHYFVR